MSFRLRAAIVGLALGASSLVRADVDPAKAAEIRKLLVITGSAQVGTQVMAQLVSSLKTAMPDVPERFWTDFQKEVKPTELQEIIVPIYDKHLSSEDLKVLIKFYESPTGKRFIAEMPAITQESMAAGQTWGQALGKRVMDKLAQEEAATKKSGSGEKKAK